MSTSVHPQLHDFIAYTELNVRGLLDKLVVVVTKLANAHENLAFIKAEVIRHALDKSSQYEAEGSVKALDEEKWLIIHLLETRNLLHARH